MMALVTVPSPSVALTFVDAAVPCMVLSEPGHVGMIGPKHLFLGDDVLRGLGGAVLKSFPLLSVSVQPRPARKMAVVLLLGPGATLPSKKLALPYPTRSMMCAASLAEHAGEPLQARPAEVSARM